VKRVWVLAVVVVVAGLATWGGFRATSSPTTTPTTTTPAASALDEAVWPTPSSGVRYATPAAAARGFATDFLTMPSPVVGAFRQGDARSGEVPVRATARGPETTVLVRQLAAGTDWYVIGASSATIVVDSPGALETVRSPMALSGRAMAFEGVVNVSVRDDSSSAPIASTTVVGGGDALRPFATTVAFSAPASRYGDLVLDARSAKDGSVTCASVLRLRF
jgi:Immunoglobulin-like domain of bacterial spore germination